MSVALPQKMKVIDVQQPGDNSELVFSERLVPQVAAGQLLVRVAAAGINRADLMQRKGLYPAPEGESDILGLEVAGIVVAVGDSSLSDWMGQAVFGLVPGGGYAEYALLQAGHAMPVPAGWSMAEAAATAEVFLTAYQLLFSIGKLTAGQKVLIHAGASGVGTAAIQLAKARGAQVAVTVSSTEKAEVCRKLGADLIINYQQQDFAQELKQQWSQGVNLILDPVAGSYMSRQIPLLAMDGIIVVFAMMGGSKLEQLNLAPLFKRRGQIICSTLRNRSDDYKRELTSHFMADFASALADKQVTPELFRVFNWQQAEQAHQLMTDNQTSGKLVLTISSD